MEAAYIAIISFNYECRCAYITQIVDGAAQSIFLFVVRVVSKSSNSMLRNPGDRSKTENGPKTVGHRGSKQDKRPARTVATEINAIGIDIRLSREIVQRSQEVINLAIEQFNRARIPIAAANGRIHRHDTRLAKSRSRLIIIGRGFLPRYGADAIAVTSEFPDYRRPLFAVSTIRRNVSGKISNWRWIFHAFKIALWRQFGLFWVSDLLNEDGLMIGACLAKAYCGSF